MFIEAIYFNKYDTLPLRTLVLFLRRCRVDLGLRDDVHLVSFIRDDLHTVYFIRDSAVALLLL